MQRAGLIEEMMTDAIDGALGDEELDTATEDEVDKILMEVAGETLAALPAAAAKKTQPVCAVHVNHYCMCVPAAMPDVSWHANAWL